MSQLSVSTTADRIVQYNRRLDQLDLDGRTKAIHQQLQQWRQDAHQSVDEVYQRRVQEIDSYVQDKKEKLDNVKSSLQLVQTRIDEQQVELDGDVLVAKLRLSAIERDVGDIEQMFVKIHIRPLNIDDQYIWVEHEVRLQSLLTNPAVIPYANESSAAIASNDQYLLFHQNPHLCMIDSQSRLAKQIVWPHQLIRDMCWSEKLESFLLLTPNHLYTLNEQLQLNVVPIVGRKSWFSCTCSEKSLYLSSHEWGSSIDEYDLLSLPNRITEWKPPSTCQPHEGINDIQYNHQTIALMINDPRDHHKRMELRTSGTFDIVWSLPLSGGINIRLFTCCPIPRNEWLFIDGSTSSLHQISADGKLKEVQRYNSVPYRANLFGNKRLVVSAETNLNLYQLFAWWFIEK